MQSIEGESYYTHQSFSRRDFLSINGLQALSESLGETDGPPDKELIDELLHQQTGRRKLLAVGLVAGLITTTNSINHLHGGISLPFLGATEPEVDHIPSGIPLDIPDSLAVYAHRAGNNMKGIKNCATAGLRPDIDVVDEDNEFYSWHGSARIFMGAAIAAYDRTTNQFRLFWKPPKLRTSLAAAAEADMESIIEFKRGPFDYGRVKAVDRQIRESEAKVLIQSRHFDRVDVAREVTGEPDRCLYSLRTPEVLAQFLDEANLARKSVIMNADIYPEDDRRLRGLNVYVGNIKTAEQVSYFKSREVMGLMGDTPYLEQIFKPAA